MKIVVFSVQFLRVGPGVKKRLRTVERRQDPFDQEFALRFTGNSQFSAQFLK